MKNKKYSVTEIKRMIMPFIPNEKIINKAIKITEKNCDYAIDKNGKFKKCFFTMKKEDGKQEEYFIKIGEKKDKINDNNIVIARKITNSYDNNNNCCCNNNDTYIHIRIINEKSIKNRTSAFDFFFSTNGEFQYAFKTKSNTDVLGIRYYNGVYTLSDNRNCSLTEKINQHDKLCLYFSHFDTIDKVSDYINNINNKTIANNEINRMDFCENCLQQYEHYIHVDLTSIYDTKHDIKKYKQICNNALKQLNDIRNRSYLNKFTTIDVFIDDHGCKILGENKKKDITDLKCDKTLSKEVIDTVLNTVNKTSNVKKICLHNLCCHGATIGQDDINIKQYIQNTLYDTLKNKNISLYMAYANKNDEIYAINSKLIIKQKNIVFYNTKIYTKHKVICTFFDVKKKKWLPSNIKNMNGWQNYTNKL